MRKGENSPWLASKKRCVHDLLNETAAVYPSFTLLAPLENLYPTGICAHGGISMRGGEDDNNKKWFCGAAVKSQVPPQSEHGGFAMEALATLLVRTCWIHISSAQRRSLKANKSCASLHASTFIRSVWKQYIPSHCAEEFGNTKGGKNNPSDPASSNAPTTLSLRSQKMLAWILTYSQIFVGSFIGAQLDVPRSIIH